MYCHKLICAAFLPNSYIHSSVSDLYIPRISLPIWLQQNRQTDPGNILIVHKCMNLEIGRQNIIILFHNKVEQFQFWEYINRNRTFILDSYRPFIYNVYLLAVLVYRWFCTHELNVLACKQETRIHKNSSKSTPQTSSSSLPTSLT